MNSQRNDVAVLGGGVVYLLALSWAIANLAYDIWGALVVVPIYGLLGFIAMRGLFRGAAHGVLKAMCWGMLAKLGGAGARYWVGFEAYEGGIDAARYHAYALESSGAFWAGDAAFVSVVPSGSGTQFLEGLTSLVYTFTGASQLAGFVTFAFLAYLGTALLVKAALVAIPGIAGRRYAWLCVVAPSLVYWPSSIGKEAVIMLGLGTFAYGLARFLSNGELLFSAVIAALGLLLVSAVRIHIAGLVVAAAISGLAVALLSRSPNKSGVEASRKVNKFGVLVVLGVAAMSLSAIAGGTVRYLSPGDVDGASHSSTETFTQILEETSRRTTKAGQGSTFVSPSVSSPANWPYASLRTLTRPLPNEARGVGALMSAAEMMLLLGLYVIYRRNLANLPRLLVSNGYVMFAVVLLFLAGLAYSSFGNLGVLVRQKSLLFPFLLLLPCLPARRRHEIPDILTPVRASDTAGDDRRHPATHSMSVGLGSTSRGSGRETFDDLWS